MLNYFVTLASFLTQRLGRDDRGATAVEYGLMVALIAAVIVTALYALIPRNVTEKISWSWSWVVPIGTAVFALYIVITGWWLKYGG